MKPEERERLELMASGDAKWDLSPNDIAAIRALLDELARLLNMAEAELAAARAVLETAQDEGALTDLSDAGMVRWRKLLVPLAAWQAWQARGKP